MNNDDFSDACQFLNLFTRIIWQTKERRCYTQADRMFDFSTLCKQLREDEPPQNQDPYICKALLSYMDEQIKQESAEFLGIGQLYSNSDKQNAIFFEGKFIVGVYKSSNEFQYSLIIHVRVLITS